jgi:hypothetical protein|tara:strand:- start:237 stop:455 length:219 start_codon:yes stop_codon:yes gene_type:complete
MKDNIIVDKIIRYVDNIDLEQISDRRFQSIVSMAEEIIKLERKVVQVSGSEEGPSAEVLNFIKSVEEATYDD